MVVEIFGVVVDGCRSFLVLVLTRLFTNQPNDTIAFFN